METFSALLVICAGDWVNNREAGDLRRYRAHYDVIVMYKLNDYLNQCWRNISKTLGFRHIKIQ